MRSKELEKIYQGLPETCATWVRSAAQAGMIAKGQMGYTLMPDADKSCVEDFNKTNGIDGHVVKAMEIGSLFGWDKAGIEPGCYSGFES